MGRLWWGLGGEGIKGSFLDFEFLFIEGRRNFLFVFLFRNKVNRYLIFRMLYFLQYIFYICIFDIVFKVYSQQRRKFVLVRVKMFKKFFEVFVMEQNIAEGQFFIQILFVRENRYVFFSFYFIGECVFDFCFEVFVFQFCFVSCIKRFKNLFYILASFLIFSSVNLEKLFSFLICFYSLFSRIILVVFFYYLSQGVKSCFWFLLLRQ